MARLIDADALKTSIYNYANEQVKLNDRRWDVKCTAIIADMLGTVDKALTVDAEPVVRCENCESWDNSEDGRYCGGWCFCNKRQISTAPDWYCADGRGAYRGDKN